MKKQLLLIVTVLAMNCYAQITFEKGYFIKNSDERVECFIKNIDWKDNPTSFEYKLTEVSEPKSNSLIFVKEFSIYNNSKYIKKTVKIDRSTSNINKLNYDKDPIFREEKVFLKTILEGKANLYSYEDNNIKRFFFNVDDSDVNQLVYKEYKKNNYKIAKNEEFKRQLWREVRCKETKIREVNYVRYQRKSLLDYFKKYNTCNNTKSITYGETIRKGKLSISMRPRLNFSSLTTGNSDVFSSSTLVDNDFGSKTGIGFGLELEYILPFNKNKWSVSLEPTFQAFKTKFTEDTRIYGTVTKEINYKSIEFPITLRHYFFLNDYSKIFANISYIIDVSFGSSLNISSNSFNRILDINSDNSIAMGIGYKFKNRYSIEGRLQTSRDILSDYQSWNSNYKTLSIILGYTLF